MSLCWLLELNSYQPLSIVLFEYKITTLVEVKKSCAKMVSHMLLLLFLLSTGWFFLFFFFSFKLTGRKKTLCICFRCTFYFKCTSISQNQMMSTTFQRRCSANTWTSMHKRYITCWRFFQFQLSSNWRTSISGCIAASSGFFLFLQEGRLRIRFEYFQMWRKGRRMNCIPVGKRK